MSLKQEMSRTSFPFYRPLKSYLQVCNTLDCKIGNKLRFFTYFLCPINTKQYTTVSTSPSVHVKMSTIKLLDYDCIGFDLDNTLLSYNVTNMVHLIYETLADYLIKEKSYDSKYLLQSLENKDLDFMQKGLFLDFEKGNLFRISSNGIIQRACHGTNLLTTKQIKEIYPDQRWEATDTFCNDMLSTWNGPISMKMRSLLDYFDISTSLIFARLIDTLDEKHEGPPNAYNVWPDMLDGLIEMFNKDHFKLDKGNFFPSLKKNPHNYIHKCNERTICWLQELKKHCKTFLITGSNVDFVDFTATYAFGKDWKSLFDIVICYAKKPGFFTEQRPFYETINYEEGAMIESIDLKQGRIYNEGNWKGLIEFLKHESNKKNPQCLYIGDNLVQDIYVPNAYVQCDTIAVIEEQMSEGMVYQGLSHPDEKVLNSTFWGSYFCLKDSRVNMDSLWGHVIKKYSKLCIPTVDVIAQEPLEKSYVCFNENGKKYDGYYPAVPLSLSTF
ncbi:5' nucleotidase A isoform X1 [Osmia lignaria lignaria]|uniref:5' nucleotidase A isoform X1 n=1 Tax=Osmia lignaria lignaria TaxID=1437193 RepID=UPI001478B002|nr:5'-nucleotidase domain-containing protein 1 isoform X1 [Osmia lignaria]